MALCLVNNKGEWLIGVRTPLISQVAGVLVVGFHTHLIFGHWADCVKEKTQNVIGSCQKVLLEGRVRSDHRHFPGRVCLYIAPPQQSVRQWMTGFVARFLCRPGYK